MSPSSIPQARAIDVHAHVALPGSIGRAGPLGPTVGTTGAGEPWFQLGSYRLEGVRYAGTIFEDVGLRLAAMDRMGIARQVLSPNPILLLAHTDPSVAAEYAAWHNHELAAVVATAPDRLHALAQVPVQDPARAVRELRRAVIELHHVGLALGTESPFDLDDPALDPLWAEAESLQVPVFVHPAPHGTDAPSPDERLARFGLDLSLGFLMEETLAVAQLVLGGVLDRHPGLEVCVSHGGGATAWLAPRLRRAATRQAGTPGDLDAGLARLWWDTHVGGGAPLDLLMATVGTERLLLGTNLAGWDSPKALLDEVPASLLPILTANAERLLGPGGRGPLHEQC